MADPQDIPEDVRRFVVANIASVPALEALLLLRSSQNECTAADVAHQLFIEPEHATVLLEELRDRGLLAERAPSTYVYAVSAELAPIVDRLAETHARQLVPLTKLIHSLTTSDARLFSDAFRVLKEKK